ncbi:secreted pili protein involved in motility and biofilm formation [Caballeronia terrestris]|jgi:spore coat protein U-like protein|uniref:Secreted pili protein involved in motility and biofilm formation n=1 Tax=Caballeronia terrestris TaxID=1226301 RepID=A0A158GT83_9BURK|nr:spore coat U domain-containing protein [Caballeronia terrestris]SAL35077.1 secreted pili protein involved in motility and biofilm formation [Caballeronia terrestris]
MRRRSIPVSLLSFALAAAPLLPFGALAATRTTTFSVTLTLQNDCQIAANTLNFGNSGVIATNIDQTTTLSVTCTNGAPYNVGLDAGSVGGSTVANRLLGGTGTPAPTVAYQLYRDAARSLIWGQTVGTDTQSGTGTGAAQTLTVYGRVAPQNTPAAGTYSSTVTATVTF